ncbi:hypothetical protein [Hwangdonia lutea]|uniref:Uncharacterized protein n=1 Tax=Hwangdonia lutea TaxID=3075823 RepID=A0AA97HR87_9FLAO|nr:hypothetical protein [Hwangdonia sp. SCSIO 19198]WOD44342.1 hypothetical protein RNZ46_03555 [Hwangdonia sp. SCSIO 19198]
MSMIEKWEKLPVFKKAMEIQKLVDHIVECVEQSDIEFENEIESEMIKNNLRYLSENAMIIPAKIAGAASEDMLYDIRMENAAIIRKSARELITDARGIQMHGFKDIEYLDLLRNEVEAFRVLFAEWVKTFDCWNYIIDRWGLFNPPGINYDDKDPDDDLPFNLDDFED